jgi:acyl-CoA dehydrogenase
MDGAATDLAMGLTAPSNGTGRWERKAWFIGQEIAGPVADDVDRSGRFPAEAVAALRAEGLLSALVPTELGGSGATLADLAWAVRALAVHCTSAALVLAMHSIEVFNIARHGTSPGTRAFLREVAERELLIASCNSEVGLGGDATRSRCAVEEKGDRLALDKEALAISYGADADVITATARRAPGAPESDQVLLICRKDDVTLEPTSSWDALGLRGTCSIGYRLRAETSPDDLVPVPFGVIASDGGIQSRQILLSAAWVGLAEAAASKAHTFVRAAARKAIGTTPLSSVRLAELAGDLQQSRSLLVTALLQFEALDAVGDLDNAGYIVALRTLKVGTSELALRVATAALRICGIAGYRRDSPHSLDRIIRDANGALVMVSNDRYVTDNATFLQVRRQI